MAAVPGGTAPAPVDPKANKGWTVPPPASAPPKGAKDFTLDAQTGSTKRTVTAQIPDEKNVSWNKPVVVAPGKPSSASGEVATLLYAGDGDGARFGFKKGAPIDCRITGYDAPETDKTQYGKRGAQPHAAESLTELKRLLAQGEIRVTVTEGPSERNFGRNLCKVEVAGKPLSRSMLEAGAGMLWQYGKDANRNAEDIAAANQAKANKVGIHSYPTPAIDPVKWKRTPINQKL